MAWLYLLLAGLFEIGWALALKYAEGFTRPWPTVLFAASMLLSIWCLALALRTIPLGTGYAIWTGIGAAGTAIFGMVIFGESRETLRIFGIILILAGIVSLKLTAS